MQRLFLIIFTLLCFCLPHGAAAATPEISGRIRSQAFFSLRDGKDTLTVHNNGDRFFADAGLDGRLTLQYQASEYVYLNCDYEMVLSGGITRSATAKAVSGTGGDFTTNPSYPDDTTRLFSLTDIITEEEDYLLYHRLDRLYLELRTGAGDISLGRQALTWGNGMIFNPVDLINPFAPSDIIRDYKLGSDMVHYRFATGSITDLQLAYVPRRERESGDVDFNVSTLGGKMSFAPAIGDLDIYGLRHYRDTVTGLGVNIFLKEALFRADVLLTIPDTGSSVFSAVANIDYSWVWLEHNWYGMLEFHYNGFGEKTPREAGNNPDLTDRIGRGDLFAAGRHYLSGQVRYEAHPLINLHTSLIFNLDDGSFYLQPRVDWDLTPSTQLLIGFNIASGPENSEYGRVEKVESDITTGTPSQVYFIITRYF